MVKLYRVALQIKPRIVGGSTHELKGMVMNHTLSVYAVKFPDFHGWNVGKTIQFS